MEKQDELTRVINLKEENLVKEEVVEPSATDETPKKPEKHILAGAIGGSSLLLFMLPQIIKGDGQGVLSTSHAVDTKNYDNKTFEEALSQTRETNGVEGFFKHQGKLYPTMKEEEWNLLPQPEKIEYLDKMDMYVNSDKPFEMDTLGEDGKPMKLVWPMLHEDLRMSIVEDNGGNIYVKDSEGNTTGLENVTKNSYGDLVRFDPLTKETSHFSPSIVLDQIDNKGYAIIGTPDTTDELLHFKIDQIAEEHGILAYKKLKIRDDGDGGWNIKIKGEDGDKLKLHISEQELLGKPIGDEEIVDPINDTVDAEIVDAQMIEGNHIQSQPEMIETLENIDHGLQHANNIVDGINDLLN